MFWRRLKRKEKKIVVGEILTQIFHLDGFYHIKAICSLAYNETEH